MVGVTKRRIENDVGGFTADAGQLLQGLPIFRHLAVVFLHQNFAGLDDILPPWC